MCWKPKNKEEKKEEKLLGWEDKLYRKGLIKEINEDYEGAQKKFNKILENQTCSFSSYWNKAYKELANINKLKREETQRCFRAKICPSLLLLGCILIGIALGVLARRIPVCLWGRVGVGLLGGAGVGLLLMARCFLSISGEND